MRLLVVNIFFDPTSFGGATVVAERVAAEIDRQSGHDATAVSTVFEDSPRWRVTRYRTRFGFDGIAVSLTERSSETPLARARNRQFDEAMSHILDFVDPDIVHIHCVQDLGASFFDLLVARGVPFAVTVHDFWYFCERQFMIDVAGEFCAQRKIDFDRCSVCSQNLRESRSRAAFLLRQLAKADLVATPSNYAREMLVENGLDPSLVRVNKNGVAPPAAAHCAARESWSDGPIRVGYLGGPGAIKGWDLIVAALRKSPSLQDRIRIIAVDAGANVGQSWREGLSDGVDDLPIEVMAGFNPAEIDEAFTRFDAVISPSRWKETFGLVVREALIRGKWVIASDAGGLAEDIVDGVSGRILPFPPHVDAVAAALGELADMSAPPKFDTGAITTFKEQAQEMTRWLEALCWAATTGESADPRNQRISVE